MISRAEILFTPDFQNRSQLRFLDVTQPKLQSAEKLSLTNIILSAATFTIYIPNYHLQLLLLCGCAASLTKRLQFKYTAGGLMQDLYS